MPDQPTHALLPPALTAFAGFAVVATGTPARVAREVREHLDRNPDADILVFDDRTGEPVELDLRGTVAEVLARLGVSDPGHGPGTGDHGAEADAGKASGRGPGRPKLGVVAREVTLLPRHWEWLNSRPEGASAALRKLVDEARRSGEARDRARLARETCYRFLTALAGDLPGYEEALRALFAGSRAGFEEHTRAWPGDVRDMAARLAAEALA
jgi:hypothetical protein